MAPFTLLAALATLSLAAGSVVKTPSNDGTFELLILHNNDMHARFEQTSQLSGACTAADRDAGKCYGGFPRVAHVVKEARKAAASGEGPPVLYLNAGDTYTGTAWFTIYKWKIAAEFLNALKPDAVSLGNHEMDEQVNGLTPFIRNVTTPVLAANLILDKVPELQNEKNLKKSVVIEVNGVNVGIIGYLTPETRYLAPKNDVEYENEVVALQREVAMLQNHGINILIALGHSGYVTDLRIAREVEGLDLVIGGHSNTFLFNGKSTEKPEQIEGPYPKMVRQNSGKMVPVVQAYAYTKYLGRLNLVFDASGEIVELHGAPILLKQDIPQDPDMLKILNKYKEDVDRVNNEVVGSSLVLLEGKCRLRQCNMGNLITDAILDYAKMKDVCANIAIVQGGRIRAPIDRPQKPFTMNKGDWFTVLPFSDPQSVVTMNGTILLQTLEHAVYRWRLIDMPGEFLQFSGMQVLYDLAKPIGSRVVSAKAKALLSNDTCAESDLVDVQEDMQYRVIMPTFLAEGGDGFNMFERLPTEITTFGELEATISYVGKNSPVNPLIDDRLILINEDKVASLSIKNKGRESRVLHSNAHFHSLSLVLIVFNLTLFFR